MSGRQSRLSALVQAAPSANWGLTGYYEMDWLGTGTSSNNNQSNSYVLRQRQIWGQAAAKSGFAVTGGQMWSLATEMRKGTDARTEIQPQTIDPQYLVGYTWTRQPELRLQQRFGDYKTGAFTAALSRRAGADHQLHRERHQPQSVLLRRSRPERRPLQRGCQRGRYTKLHGELSNPSGGYLHPDHQQYHHLRQ